MTKQSRETIYTIAKKAGVSASTVSRVMDGTGNVAPATASRVRAVIEATRFQRNSLARNLSKNDSDTFAILLPDLTNPYFPMLVREIQKQCESAGFGILLCDTHNDTEIESRFLDKMISRNVKSVFIAGSTLSEEKLTFYANAGLNFISVDRALPIPSDLVQSDNYVGSCIAVEHLVSLGHTKILHIQGPKAISTAVERYQGFKDTMQKYNLQAQSSQIGNFEFSELGGRQAFAEILRTKIEFSAIFAAADLIAIGILFAAEENGYNVPADFSLIGFDDIVISKYVRPRLTTIRQDIPAIAKELVVMAMSSNTIREKQEIVVPVSIEIRESTRKMKN